MTNDFFMKNTVLKLRLFFACSPKKPLEVVIKFEHENGDGDGGDDEGKICVRILVEVAHHGVDNAESNYPGPQGLTRGKCFLGPRT